MVLGDGGGINDTNVISAVTSCLDLVDGDQSKITVDISICAPHPQAPTEGDVSHDAGLNFLQAFLIKQAFNGFNAISWQIKAFPEVNYRYLFLQEEGILLKELLDFRN